MNILVETSARHVHVTEADLETLFGKGYQLTVKKELSQPGQYASNERVTVVGPKRGACQCFDSRPVPQRHAGGAEHDRCALHWYCRTGA